MILEYQNTTVVLHVIFNEVELVARHLEHVYFGLWRLEFLGPLAHLLLVPDRLSDLNDDLINHLVELLTWNLLKEVSAELDDKSRPSSFELHAVILIPELLHIFELELTHLDNCKHIHVVLLGVSEIIPIKR